MTEWRPLGNPRQWNVLIDIGDIGDGLVLTKIKVANKYWGLSVNHTNAMVYSLDKKHVPDWISSSPAEFKKAVAEVERAASYMRAVVTFALETPSKRGFESDVLGHEDGFFPSDSNKQSYKMNDGSRKLAEVVLNDIGKKYNKQVHQLTEYWRRGFELEEMGYYAEAYLNYYKVLEAMSKRINKGTHNIIRINLVNRFNTPDFKKRYGFKKEDVKFTASVFAFIGYRNVNRSMFRMVCHMAKVRNHYNVGHVSAITYGVHSANGQFSDSFDLTDIEGHYLKEVARVMILHSLGYRNYWLDGTSGPYSLRLKVPK